MKLCGLFYDWKSEVINYAQLEFIISNFRYKNRKNKKKDLQLSKSFINII